MNPTIDYQVGAIYGDAPNSSALDATMLNPAATGPDDWKTILANGISGAAVMGAYGMTQNAIDRGQIANGITPGNPSLVVVAHPINPMHLLILGVIIYLVVRK